ncbi:hypothetical protein D3C72_257510 [compost metagenome]
MDTAPRPSASTPSVLLMLLRAREAFFSSNFRLFDLENSAESEEKKAAYHALDDSLQALGAPNHAEMHNIIGQVLAGIEIDASDSDTYDIAADILHHCADVCRSMKEGH